MRVLPGELSLECPSWAQRDGVQREWHVVRANPNTAHTQCGDVRGGRGMEKRHTNGDDTDRRSHKLDEDQPAAPVPSAGAVHVQCG